MAIQEIATVLRACMKDPYVYFVLDALWCWNGFRAGVGGKSVRQADVSGGTHFPRKLCPTGQDILSVLG